MDEFFNIVRPVVVVQIASGTYAIVALTYCTVLVSILLKYFYAFEFHAIKKNMRTMRVRLKSVFKSCVII